MTSPRSGDLQLGPLEIPTDAENSYVAWVLASQPWVVTAALHARLGELILERRRAGLPLDPGVDRLDYTVDRTVEHPDGTFVVHVSLWAAPAAR